MPTKTMTGLSLLGLLPQPAGRIVNGSIKLAGRELVGLDETTLASEIRGREKSVSVDIDARVTVLAGHALLVMNVLLHRQIVFRV